MESALALGQHFAGGDPGKFAKGKLHIYSDARELKNQSVGTLLATWETLGRLTPGNKERLSPSFL